MARLTIEGLDDLMDDLDSIMDLPDAVQDAMLNAEADVVVRAQKEQIRALKLVDTGQLEASIARNVKVETGSGMSRYLDVYPQGDRREGGRNAEVGFIHEFGAPKRHIRASGWVSAANEKCAPETTEAAYDVYDDFLKQHNL